MSQTKSDNYQPRSVIWRGKYSEHLGQVQGVLDFDTNFDNSFQRWKLVMEFIQDVQEAIRQGIIPIYSEKRYDLLPDKDAIRKLDKIWNGTTYLRILRNKKETKVIARELFFEKPSNEVVVVSKGNNWFIQKLNSMLPDNANKETYYAEIKTMPRLKNMIPVREIREDTWGIQIREPMVLKDGLEGANYGTVVNDGKFIHYLSDGAMPKFEANDMDSEKLMTYVIHRPVYFAIMDILKPFFDKYYFVFAGNVQRIKDWLEELEMEGYNGGEEEIIPEDEWKD